MYTAQQHITSVKKQYYQTSLSDIFIIIYWKQAGLTTVFINYLQLYDFFKYIDHVLSLHWTITVLFHVFLTRKWFLIPLIPSLSSGVYLYFHIPYTIYILSISIIFVLIIIILNFNKLSNSNMTFINIFQRFYLFILYWLSHKATLRFFIDLFL